jgi:circadian clock protein KaiB
MNHSVARFRLYIAGDAPNSKRAITNLTNFCRRHLPDGHHIEVVDLLKTPRRALDDNVLVTPTLFIAAPHPAQTIVGDLSDPTVLLLALGLGGGIT